MVENKEIHTRKAMQWFSLINMCVCHKIQNNPSLNSHISEQVHKKKLPLIKKITKNNYHYNKE